MSTLVGHALAATLATSTAGREAAPRRGLLVAVAVATAMLPDLDIVFFLALRPVGMVPHRGFSHTLLFAAASATVIALLTARVLRMSFGRVWLVLILAAASHPLLDYLMGAGPPVQLFAPFSERGYLCPWRVLPTAFYGKSWGAYGSASFFTLNAVAAGLEVVIFAPLILTSVRSTPARAKWLALVVALAGIAITRRLYG
jgi:inner membrane protein